MERQTATRLGIGVFALFALSLSGMNLYKRHQRQALIEATQNKEELTVKHLLFTGVPADAGIPFGQSRPIHVAIANGEKSALLDLMIFKAEINAPDEQGRTPLFIALATMPDSMIEKMLSMGADPKGKRVENELCLPHAALLGRKAVIPLLLAQGAQVDAKDRSGETALMAALRGAAATLDIRVSPPNAPFKEDHLGVVEELLKAGATPNGTNAYGMTPLMQAAIVLPNAGPDPVRFGSLLLSKGATVDARMSNFIDSERRTALMLAANLGNTEFVTLLLGHGADPNLRSTTGKTARDYTVRSLANTPLPRSTAKTKPLESNAPALDEDTIGYLRLKATLAILDKVTKH